MSLENVCVCVWSCSVAVCSENRKPHRIAKRKLCPESEGHAPCLILPRSVSHFTTHRESGTRSVTNIYMGLDEKRYKERQRERQRAREREQASKNRRTDGDIPVSQKLEKIGNVGRTAERCHATAIALTRTTVAMKPTRPMTRATVMITHNKGNIGDETVPLNLTVLSFFFVHCAEDQPPARKVTRAMNVEKTST